MIELREISKSYMDRRNREVNALTNISISFSCVGFYAITGKSGSGKSTLLNILSGMDRPTSGSYKINNEDTNQYNDNDWVILRQQVMSYIFQDFNLIDKLTVKENLVLSLLNRGINDADILSKIDDVLTEFDLINLKDQFCQDLSGGEKQRISIIRTVLCQSKVIIADEPTSSLDEYNTIKIYELLKELSKSRLVIVVTHDIDMTNRFADFVINLNYGKIDKSNVTQKSIEHVSYDKQHNTVNMKRLYQVSKYFNKGQYLTQVFMIIFLILGMTFLTTSMTLALFDETILEYNVIKQNNIDYNFISASEMNFETNEQTSQIDIDLFGQTFTSNRVFVNQFDFYTSFINQSPSNAPIFKTIIIDDLEDYHIVITDYQALQFKHHNILTYEDVSELVGHSILFYGIELIIDDVIDTDYDPDTILVSDDYLLKYDLLHVNEKTLKTMVLRTSDKLFTGTIGMVSIRHPYLLETHIAGEYIGSNNLSNQEIVVDIVTLQNLVGVVFDHPEDAMVYFDTTFELNLEGDYLNVSDSFILKGIVFYEKPTIYFSESYFNSVFEADVTNLDIYFSTLKVEVPNQSVFNELHSYIENMDLYLMNEYSSDTYFVKSFIQSVMQIFMFIAVISVSLVTLFILFFTRLYFKQNMYHFGVLLALGYSKTHTLIISFMSILRNIVMAFIISSILSFIVLFWFNHAYQQELMIDIPVISHRIMPYLMTLCLSVLLTAFGLVNAYFSTKKIDIIQLLKR